VSYMVVTSIQKVVFLLKNFVPDIFDQTSYSHFGLNVVVLSLPFVVFSDTGRVMKHGRSCTEL
jgi:hypothetical protein